MADPTPAATDGRIDPPPLHCARCGERLAYESTHFFTRTGGASYHPKCLALHESEASAVVDGYWMNAADGMPPPEYAKNLTVTMRASAVADAGRWGDWYTLSVPLPSGDGVVRMREWLGGLPKAEYAPLSPDVAEHYELRDVVTTFLVQKKA